MDVTYTLAVALVILHIACAAAWFGLGLRLTAWGRALAGLSGDARAALADLGGRTVKLMNVFALLTAVFAFATLGVGISAGADYGWPYHAASALILVLAAVQYALIAPAWKTLADGASGEALGRLAAGTGIGHLVWLVILVLMFVQQGGYVG